MKTKDKNINRLIARGLFLVMFFVALSAYRPQPVLGYTGTLKRYTVNVKKNYLALRTAKAFKAENEIGKLYKGDKVIHCPTSSENSDYWYVYSPDLNKLGYVNRHYLDYDKQYTGDIHYKAKVKRGYLALRSRKKYDASNEKGKMYTGDDVIVLHKSSSDYWTVYSPDLEKAGYTNKHFLKRDHDYDEDDDDEEEDYEEEADYGEEEEDEDEEEGDIVYDDSDYDNPNYDPTNYEDVDYDGIADNSEDGFNDYENDGYEYADTRTASEENVYFKSSNKQPGHYNTYGERQAVILDEFVTVK